MYSRIQIPFISQNNYIVSLKDGTELLRIKWLFRFKIWSALQEIILEYFALFYCGAMDCVRSGFDDFNIPQKTVYQRIRQCRLVLE